MPTQHKLKDEQLKICCNNITLEGVSKWELLGVTIDKTLTLNKHLSPLLLIKLLLILEYLKKLKRYKS